jgi:branched-chain amino acid aminotransferase
MAFHSVDGGIRKSERIWVNGTLMPWDDCKVHVLSHVLHYGSSVFEGIRCYATTLGPAVFRLHDHLQRLLDSARVYRMPIPYTLEQLEEAACETVAATGLDACYLRPIVFRGYGSLGVNPLTCPVETVIAAFPWGQYLGKDAVEKGVDVRVASWSRFAANTIATVAKTSANYANSQLVKMEALADGYAEGIVLDVNGNVSEGSGENIFLVRGRELLTPSLACAILPGITRDTVMTLARGLGYTVTETEIPRSDVYRADELFFTGTAAEITPIRSVDRITIGSGTRGPITKRLQEAFFAVVSGRDATHHAWLSPVRGRRLEVAGA